MTCSRVYLEPGPSAARAFFSSPVSGPIVMLNLLRFREAACYHHAPHLAPAESISGAAAFSLYVDQTLPMLLESGGELLYYGRCGNYLIGPKDESWDAVMLTRQASRESFLAFASNPEYLEVLHHRTAAALVDSRLLPVQASAAPQMTVAEGTS